MDTKITHTVLLHGLEYSAYVTDENDDGSLELTAIALNNKQPFPVSRARKAPADASGIDPHVPFYVKREEPKAEKPKAEPKS